MLASIPMGRLGQGEDVAKAVAFFSQGRGRICDGTGPLCGRRHGRINKEETMEKRRVVITGMERSRPGGLPWRRAGWQAWPGTCASHPSPCTIPPV